MGLSDLVFRAIFKGSNMPSGAEMLRLPVPGIKKAPGFGGLRDKKLFVV